MKPPMHLLFCRLGAAVAATWGCALLLRPELSSGLPAGELPVLHARCVGVLHLALALGLSSARRGLDAAAARLPLLLGSCWGAAAVAAALIQRQPVTGQVWLACMALAAACAAWLLARIEDTAAPAERMALPWLALALGAGMVGTPLLLAPDLAAAHWPWRMARVHAAAYGAPLLGLGVMAWAAARERRRYVREPALHAWLVLAVGFLALSVLHRALFMPTRVVTWVWFGLLTAVAAWAAAHCVRPLRARRLWPTTPR